MKTSPKRMLLAVILFSLAPAAPTAQSAQQRTLTWSASADADRITEYRVERNFVPVGSTTEVRFPFWISPGETVTLGVRSFGWCQDLITGGFFGCEGPLSDLLTYTEPTATPLSLLAPTPSADGATCQVGTGCSLVDTDLNVWALDSSWAILRNGQHWIGGYSDWLVSLGGAIYAYRSDMNGWWVATPSGWASMAYDPRTPSPSATPSADGATCQVGTGCSLVDAELNEWTLDGNWAILRKGQHWNGGYSDWLLWFGGQVYAHRSDTNEWWVDTLSGWRWLAE